VVTVPLKRTLPTGLVPHGGSQWWCLTRKCVAHIDRYLRENPAVIRYFRRAFIPDECLFQTVVMNSPFAERVTGVDPTLLDWTRPNPNVPRTFTFEDLPYLRQSDLLYARKFDAERDARVLDSLDEITS
jgi:hypothetical protein